MIWEGWKGMNKIEKVMITLTMLYSACIIILAVLHLGRIIELPVYISYILLGILSLLQTVNNWKKSKLMVILGLCAAVLFFATAVNVLA